jgi:glutamate racemase
MSAGLPSKSAIGIFDSGYGGLTVFRSIAEALPEYDFIYLGDNARAPYGNRAFSTVHDYTLQCVKWFFSMNCPLVILACNTASAKALRTIQQNDLPQLDNTKRVLGVIRPTAEVIAEHTRSNKIGILGTKGTILSGSYEMEIHKLNPEIEVFSHACPMWVPLIENNEYNSPGAEYFIKKDIDALLRKAPDIDALLLACTHYPLLSEKIRQYLPSHINIITQGAIVAQSLAAYLHRHKDMDKRLSKQGEKLFYTTDDTNDFNEHAGIFFGQKISALQIHL